MSNYCLYLRSFFTFLVILLVSFHPLQSLAADEDPIQPITGVVLESASELDYPPFALVLDDGSADGFSVELLREVVKATGQQINFSVGPWHVIKEQLMNGTLDVLPLVSYSNERDKKLDFSAPYMRLHGTIFVRKGTKGISSEADLKGKEVLVMRDDNAHEYAAKNSLTDKLVLTSNYGEAMKLLSAGEHDAVVMLHLVGLQLLEHLGIENVVSINSFQPKDIKPDAKPLTGYEQKFCFAVPEGDKERLAMLNEGLAIVIANGRYNELFDKWFGPILPDQQISWATILKYLLFILIPVIFIFAVVGAWLSRKEVAHKTEHLNKEIQARKETENTLLESERKFRNLFSVAAIPMCYVNYDGVILDFNTKFTQLFGYTREDIPTLEEWWIQAYPDPEYRQWVLRTWQEAVDKAAKEQSEIESIQYDVTCKDGNVRKVIISGTTLQDHFLATFVDLTDLKSAEEKFQRFFLMISDIFCIADIKGRFRLINPAAQKILGYTEDELLAKSYLDFVHPDDRENTIRIVEEKLKTTSEVFNFLNRYICKDGSTKWLEWTSHIVPDQGVIFAVARDVTERRKMVEELKASELWQRNIFNALEESVLVVSPERELLQVNRATEEIFGYTAQELATQTTAILHVDDEHYAEFGKKIQEAFEQGKAAEFEFIARRKNGEIFPTEHTVSQLRDASDTPLGIISVVRDISERKRTEKVLQETLKNLERSNSELQQFAYVASHDLQEPLRATVGFLQLLQSRYRDQLDDKGHHYIERAVKAGSRMQNLINDLLNLSRVSTKESRFEQTDLNDVIQEVLDSSVTGIEEKGAKVNSAALPTLSVDCIRIQALFQNLISNALKYNDSERPIIEIGHEEESNEHRFFVKDNGIGIDSKFYDRIFMIFQRLHTTQQYSGTGIGLALCKKIVELHNGRIWVESQKGKGSTFYFTLPKNKENS